MRNTHDRVAERARRLRFERLVGRVLRSLPKHIHHELDNVEFVVEDEPRSRDSGGADEVLFGLYSGTPRNERDGGYTMSVPDVITLFRGPLERAFPAPDDLKAEIRITLLHEIAHHLGIDEARVAEIGLA
jgi:predicted Zn-dependent protease with MMP-like domain